ncbi:WxL domain-containing protein [Enterococcus sp. LJL98]
MKKERLMKSFVWISLVLMLPVTQVNAANRLDKSVNGRIKYQPGNDKVDPVNPEDPDPDFPVKPIAPVNPGGPDLGTTGPLSIDYISEFDFGLNPISNRDEVYYARAQAYEEDLNKTPNFVQVSDRRGVYSGWTLTVKQESQFQATKQTEHQVLEGAMIRMLQPTVKSNAQGTASPVASNELSLVPGIETKVVVADSESGAGTWVAYWGEVEAVDEKDEHGKKQVCDVTKAVQLHVPGESPKDPVTYQTKLVWNLIDVVEN